MRTECPRVVVAAPASGGGKSTIATGIMACLAETCTVQGFKVGPDYIDPMYHTAATGRPSRNLDTWMVPREGVMATFARCAADADVAVIEGVMGLYDGYDAASEAGSTAEVAKLLNAPVILVLDVSKMARSAGALALGYRDYDPALRVAAVICNRVASERHAACVREAVEAIGLPVLGCVPRSAGLHIPERHLGLYTAVERRAEVEAFLAHARALVAQHTDLDALWRLARQAGPIEADEPILRPMTHPPVRLAVARDEAFCFYYEDNLDLLRAAGAEVAFFSPLRDQGLPPDTAGIYLGGGYPELYAAQLSANEDLRRAIRAAHAADMPIYAECGGLMALTQSLTDGGGTSHAMIGLLPGHSRMLDRLVMGYREVRSLRDCLLLGGGETTRGHEFHYSEWVPAEPTPPAYAIAPRTGETERTEGIARGNLLASYVHLHFGARPDMAPRLVAACARWRAAQEPPEHPRGR